MAGYLFPRSPVRGPADGPQSLMSTAWIIPSNGRMFDSEAAFRNLPEVDWSEVGTSSIAVGDVVYLYSSSPISAISHKCVVTAVRLPPSELINDSAYWLDQGAMVERLTRRSWMRLKRRFIFDNGARAKLGLKSLQAHGLRGTMAGRQKVQGELLEYVLQVEALTHGDDSLAESSEVDPHQVGAFKEQIKRREFAVPDSTVRAKTRGSAQRVFADEVKSNYGYQCAITGITTRAFLVASHIVPWSEDASVRLDPSNGICLSTLVDRAFDTGFLTIDADCTVHIDEAKIGADPALLGYLGAYEGRPIRMPSEDPPRVGFLLRRLETI